MITLDGLSDRYKVTSFLAEGGMGQIYRGIDSLIDRPVIIKRVRPDLLHQQPDLLARLAREGQALRRLNHPNIVKLLDVIAQDDQHYLVLEYIDGEPLTEENEK